MGVSYQGVQWSPQKKRYDRWILGMVVGYLLAFVGGNVVLFPDITPETLIIRAFGSLALVMLHIILLIGPLCRMNKRFLPLLYNRRHLGVSMFLVGSVHAVFSLIQFHAGGDTNPLVSLFIANTHYASIANFPFQTLGFFAWVILLLMAATSHDFWLHNLSPKVWKALHMLVYIAYGLLIMHVALGALQQESASIYYIVLAVGVVLVVGLHLISGLIELKRDQDKGQLNQEGFVEVGAVDQIPENRALVVNIDGERIAIFRYEGKLSAVSNVCKHQLGPLGEGKVIDGCITCPWHGYQYEPHNGCSPPPFKEKVATYEVKLKDQIVWVNPKPFAEGTAVEPALIPAQA